MSMDDEDLSGYSMLDLFRMETREQMRVLTDGLLQLEQGTADAAMLEAMMRAAHSVKGAAVIVGLDPAVRLAHAMEDVLVAGIIADGALEAALLDTARLAAQLEGLLR